jgi:hypothetical protein
VLHRQHDVGIAVPHRAGDEPLPVALLQAGQPRHHAEPLDRGLSTEQPDEQDPVALLEQVLHRAHQRPEPGLVGGVLAAVHAEADELAVLERGIGLEELARIGVVEELLHRVDHGVADDVDRLWRIALVEQVLAVQLHRGRVQL